MDLDIWDAFNTFHITHYDNINKNTHDTRLQCGEITISRVSTLHITIVLQATHSTPTCVEGAPQMTRGLHGGEFNLNDLLSWKSLDLSPLEFECTKIRMARNNLHFFALNTVM